MFDEKFRFHETGLDLAMTMEIKELALEQVKIHHRWNDDTERALMADRRYTSNWSEAEQTHFWEYDE